MKGNIHRILFMSVLVCWYASCVYSLLVSLNLLCGLVNGTRAKHCVSGGYTHVTLQSHSFYAN